jgi:hypothetical protein
MLWTLSIILILLWALGLATSVTFAGFIHVLIGVAIGLIAAPIIQRASPKKAAQP